MCGGDLYHRFKVILSLSSSHPSLGDFSIEKQLEPLFRMPTIAIGLCYDHLYTFHNLRLTLVIVFVSCCRYLTYLAKLWDKIVV